MVHISNDTADIELRSGCSGKLEVTGIFALLDKGCCLCHTGYTTDSRKIRVVILNYNLGKVLYVLYSTCVDGSHTSDMTCHCDGIVECHHGGSVILRSVRGSKDEVFNGSLIGQEDS